MKTISKRLILKYGALVLVSLLLIAQGAGATPQAQAPQPEAPTQTLISYQGTLTDENGDPITVPVTMQFALYNASSNGTKIWGTETQGVQVTDGLFNVLLGSVTPIDPAKLTGDLWLDIKVNNEQLTPRERITSVPYAAEAGTLPVGARTRGNLIVNGDLQVISPADGIAGLHLWRTDEADRTHWWTLWHMNQDYGTNSLQIWEYRNDSNGVACGGNPNDGAICNPRLTIEQGGDVCIGCGSAPAANLEVVGAVSAAMGGSFGADVNMNGHSIINCGALTEANLQTPGELAAGGSDRFEEGDVLCWGVDQLELCATPNDPLVQAVADESGRPIVLGAEVIKVLGPVKRGDYLVASSVPGYAMATPNPAFGIVIAQALEDFDGGRGLIEAMIRKL